LKSTQDGPTRASGPTGGEKVCKARQRVHSEGSIYGTYVTERCECDNEAWRALSLPHYING
jgi:hypothetical protein